MENYFKEIEVLLPSVLEKGAHYTAASAAEEFKQEYPKEFAAFIKAYAAEFDFSGCGQRRGHINGFAIILANLEKKGILEKVTEEKVSYWQKI